MRRLLPLLALSVHALAVTPRPDRPRYVFLFIGDGMGAAQVALAEAWKASHDGDSTGFSPTVFSRFPVRGEVTTHCAVRRITESAAAATAMAGGSKAGEAVIGLDPHDNAPMRSLAEEARDAGVPVGIMTSVSVNHATPAAFYAHVDSRDKYWEIGRQLTTSRMPLFAGGGFQEPVGKPGKNQPDLHDLAKQKGFRIVQHRDSLASLKTLPAILFSPAPAGGTALPWAMDPADPSQPRLADFVGTGIRLLEGDNGFFLMAEGGKVDWACHANDARAAIGEVWDLDAAVQLALEFGRKHPDETLILVTADHETGGLSLGNGLRGYQSDFGLLTRQRLSQERLADSLRVPFEAGLGKLDSARHFATMIAEIGRWTGLGQDPRLGLDRDDTLELARAYSLSLPGRRPVAGLDAAYWGRNPPLALAATRILGRKAGVGWTSLAHTALPVPLYAWGVGADRFGGRLDNTDIPARIRSLVGWKPLAR
jgi:alkaline phosphatase